MTDLEHLINMNVEIEGLLRVLENRDNASARSILSDKIKAYNALIEAYLSVPAEADSEIVEFVTDSIPVEMDNKVVVMEEKKEEPEPAPERDTVEDTVVPVQPVQYNVNLAKAFTLNDRFRFKRELFGGNDDDFTDTIQLLSEMETYNEAEDYLLTDMMWDSDSESVKDFLSILAGNMPDGTR